MAKQPGKKRKDTKEIADKQKAAIKWWKERLEGLRGKVTAGAILNRHKDRFRPMPGYFVLLEYSAKHWKTLPYWDKFPLAVILDIHDDGWLALNLHYLPLTLREKAFKAIQKRVKAKKKITKQTRAAITYAVFKSIAELSIARPCIKKHLFSRMKRGPMRITWDEAAQHAIFLDLEKWMVGRRPSQSIRRSVYRDSRLAVRGRTKKGQSRKWNSRRA